MKCMKPIDLLNKYILKYFVLRYIQEIKFALCFILRYLIIFDYRFPL